MRNSELCWLGRGEEALREKKDEQPEMQEENQAVGITEAKRRGALLGQVGRKGALVGATVSNAVERSVKLWIESELLGKKLRCWLSQWRAGRKMRDEEEQGCMSRCRLL